MTLRERLHGSWVFPRRVRVLSQALGGALAPCRPASLLDVGCGDGQITALTAALLPGISARGIDVLQRSRTHVPVETFAGERLPYADGAFAAVMAVDVLHHADEPGRLLAEMVRVSSRWVVLKDHFRDGWLAQATLRFMDEVGNRQHGVRLPYRYLSRSEWEQLFATLGLRVVQRDSLPTLYPWPLRLVFGRQLHFIAVLEKSGTTHARGCAPDSHA